MSSALTSGMPPDSSVASVRETCAVASVRASGPKYGSRRIAACSRRRCPGCRNQSTNADHRGGQAPEDQRAAADEVRRDRDDDPRRQRQLRALAELPVEVGELRHDLEDDQPDDRDRERDQDGRIDQRRDHLRPRRREHLHVLHVAANDLLEAAALLTRHQRRGIDAGEQALRLERLRQRGARADLVVDVVERGPEHRVRHALAQDVERLDERQSGFEQRRQFLVEDQELGRAESSGAAARPAGAARRRTPPPCTDSRYRPFSSSSARRRSSLSAT